MGVVGAWISLRRPASPIGWLFLAAASTASLLMWAEAVVDETLATGGQWEGAALWALLWTDIAWYVSFALVRGVRPAALPRWSAVAGLAPGRHRPGHRVRGCSSRWRR